MSNAFSKLNLRSKLVKIILAISTIIFLLIYFAQLFPLDNLISSIWGTDNVTYPSLAIMAGAWALAFILFGFIRVQSVASKRNLTFLSILLVVALIGLQIYLISSYEYVGNYDAAITKYQAFDLHKGASEWQDYFYYYTNTVGFVTFMKRILDFGQSLGWLGIGAGNFVELYQFILVDLGLFGIFWTIRRRNIPAANVFLLLAIIYQPLHTNSFEFYSDSISMVIPALFVFLNDQIFNSQKNRNRYIAMVLLIMLLGFAFYIKQNLIVLLIAEIIIVLLFWNKLKDVERASLAIGVITSFFIFSVTFSSWKNTDGYLENQNRAFPAYTWMALGYNVESRGQFSQSDFFSYDSINSADEKTNYARDLFLSRLQGLGPTGIFNQWVTKFRVMWSDSTFDSLRYQNSFIGPLPQHDKNPIQTDVRLRNFNQIIITALSLLTFLGLARTLFKRKTPTSDNDQLLMTIFVLPVLGLTAFHVIFWEVESRYVTSLIPILLGIGSLSASFIYSGFETRFAKTPKTTSRFISGLLLATIILNVWSVATLPNSLKLKNSNRLINTTASLPNGVRDYVGASSALFGKNYLLHYQTIEGAESIIQKMATSAPSNQIWFSELPDGVQPSVINDKGDEWDLTLIEGQTYNFKMPAGIYKIRFTNYNDYQVKLPVLYAPYQVGAMPMNLKNNPTVAIVTYNNAKNILKNIHPARGTYVAFIVGLGGVYYLFRKNYQSQRVVNVAGAGPIPKPTPPTNNKKPIVAKSAPVKKSKPTASMPKPLPTQQSRKSNTNTQVDKKTATANQTATKPKPVISPTTNAVKKTSASNTSKSKTRSERFKNDKDDE